MDDLSSFDWNASKAAPLAQQPSASKSNHYPALRPTPPLSGRSTPNLPSFPSSAQKPAGNALTGSRGSTPANDSFANLVSFNAAQPMKNLSLQEQQQRMQQEKVKQEAENKRAFDNQFGDPSTSVSSWLTRGDGQSTPDRMKGSPTYTATSKYGGQNSSTVINKPGDSIPAPSGNPPSQPVMQSEDDILAAFSASAPVDKSSHMPMPSNTISLDSIANGAVQTANMAGGSSNGYHTRNNDGDDDDPFGLGMGPSKTTQSQNTTLNGNEPAQTDDDVLGMLSRPVSDFPKQELKEEKTSKSESVVSKNPKIRALSELVDMGFEPAKCKLALESTESGTDVQAAVSWLLNQAHEQSKNKMAKSRTSNVDMDGGKDGQHPRRPQNRRTGSNAAGTRPAWMEEQGSGQRRQDSRSPAKGDKDPAQYASELGSSLFKTANSLWKTGQKKLNQAVAELNAADSVNPSQPKWMKEASRESGPRRPQTQQTEIDSKITGGDPEPGPPQSDRKAVPPDVTNEALLLESGGRPLPRKTTTQTMPEFTRKTLEEVGGHTSSRQFKHREEPLPHPRFMQQVPRDPRSKLSRQAVEDEAAAAYVSPARRKKTAPKPQSKEPELEPDLLFNDDDSKASPKPAPPTVPIPAAPRARTIPSKPLPQHSPPQRAIPPLSSIALQSSTASRRAGTESFKRGDYAHATLEYTKALGSLPPTHPLTIVILTNRALSHSKIGDPKASIADATTAIDLIGPTRGVGESIDLAGDEGTKPMDSYWGKAMQRKAEGFEHLERWADAAAAWRSCIEAGVGGATSIMGRNRCENAAKPRPPPAARKIPPRPKASALSDLAPDSAQSAEAVNRLRAANAAADKLDDEKFRLADVVDDRVSRWRAGKEGNLRALLASLENVLWADAGWKKTSMGELIQTNKVKIIYMRGISKVHPDKVRQTLSVFVYMRATLTAWFSCRQLRRQSRR